MASKIWFLCFLVQGVILLFSKPVRKPTIFTKFYLSVLLTIFVQFWFLYTPCGHRNAKTNKLRNRFPKVLTVALGFKQIRAYLLSFWSGLICPHYISLYGEYIIGGWERCWGENYNVHHSLVGMSFLSHIAARTTICNL